MGWYGEPVYGGEGIVGVLIFVFVGLFLYGVVKNMRDERAMTLEDRALRRTELSERDDRLKAQPDEFAKESLGYEMLTTRNPKWATDIAKFRLVSVEFVVELIRERVQELESSIYWSRRMAEETESKLLFYRDDEMALGEGPSREGLEHMEHEVHQSRFEAGLFEKHLEHRKALLKHYEGLMRELKDQVLMREVKDEVYWSRDDDFWRSQ